MTKHIQTIVVSLTIAAITAVGGRGEVRVFTYF